MCDIERINVITHRNRFSKSRFSREPHLKQINSIVLFSEENVKSGKEWYLLRSEFTTSKCRVGKSGLNFPWVNSIQSLFSPEIFPFVITILSSLLAWYWHWSAPFQITHKNRGLAGGNLAKYAQSCSFASLGFVNTNLQKSLQQSVKKSKLFTISTQIWLNSYEW